ncbi:hypothetical protein [Nocardia puris]|uniref:Uncharacterized protein n=1 Tax=Nocardia puris TaxID=208602 RepID=A0A366CWX2_9NOCA|nr:hypothetical protein [Nocardia puris]RBO82115.1 hypothetical protein DFR74_12570 [Nocardia puris]
MSEKKPPAARWKNGEPIGEIEADMIAKAFGFTGAQHMNDVSAGRVPTAFGRIVRRS